MLIVPPENAENYQTNYETPTVGFVDSSVSQLDSGDGPQILHDPIFRPRNFSPELELFRNDSEAIECSLDLIEKMEMSNIHNNESSASNLKDALDGLMLDELSYGNPAIKVMMVLRLCNL